MKPYGHQLQKYCFKFEKSKIIFLRNFFCFDTPNRPNLIENEWHIQRLINSKLKFWNAKKAFWYTVGSITSHCSGKEPALLSRIIFPLRNVDRITVRDNERCRKGQNVGRPLRFGYSEANLNQQILLRDSFSRLKVEQPLHKIVF